MSKSKAISDLTEAIGIGGSVPINEYGQARAGSKTEATYITALLTAAIHRNMPPNSVYPRHLEDALEAQKNSYEGYLIPNLTGIARSLRRDIENDFSSISGTIRAEAFSDFLEMATHLLSEGYKDAAAVIAGTVLEQHLRSLADNSGISARVPDGRWKKAETINAELASNNVITKLEQKNITAWLGLRNEAAHGNYHNYDLSNVRLLIDSIGFFMSKTPS